MIVDSKNIPQFIDELNIEVDQIKKELQQTVRNVEYASEYSDGVKLGDLIVGSQSTQVITPQITMTAGPESGQFFLELPVGTESALTLPVGTESGQIVRPEVQNDANAASLVPEALLTGRTVESFLNSNITSPKLVSSETVKLSDTHNLIFYLYSNGVKCCHVADGSVPAALITAVAGTVPAKYRPLRGGRYVGVNSNYTSTSSADRARVLQLAEDGAIAVQPSSANGLYITYYYV